jgi:hypothetical protein
VRLEVALEIEDLELIRFSESEELAERSIRLDHLLHHESVVLRILADASSHFRTAELSALGYTEEGAESIRDLSRLGEDSVLLRLIFAIRSLVATTTALLSLLELTRDLLLELLHVRMKSAEGSTELVHTFNDGVELGHYVHFFNGSRSSFYVSDYSRSSNYMGSNYRGSLGGLGRSSYYRSSDRRSYRSSRGGGSGSLAASFLSNLSGRHFLYRCPRSFLANTNAGMLIQDSRILFYQF